MVVSSSFSSFSIYKEEVSDRQVLPLNRLLPGCFSEQYNLQLHSQSLSISLIFIIFIYFLLLRRYYKTFNNPLHWGSLEPYDVWKLVKENWWNIFPSLIPGYLLTFSDTVYESLFHYQTLLSAVVSGSFRAFQCCHGLFIYV